MAVAYPVLGGTAEPPRPGYPAINTAALRRRLDEAGIGWHDASYIEVEEDFYDAVDVTVVVTRRQRLICRHGRQGYRTPLRAEWRMVGSTMGYPERFEVHDGRRPARPTVPMTEDEVIAVAQGGPWPDEEE